MKRLIKWLMYYLSVVAIALIFGGVVGYGLLMTGNPWCLLGLFLAWGAFNIDSPRGDSDE
jgi:hypothetical protein